MHFYGITLENVGPFRGVQNVEFDYGESGRANVVCGGGGSGMTFFVKAMEWALAGEDENAAHFYSRQWRHQNDETLFDGNACVTLRLELCGRDYEIARRRIGGDETPLRDVLNLRRRTTGKEGWEPIDNPELAIRAMIPSEIRRALFFSDYDDIFEASERTSLSVLSIPEFRSWVSRKLGVTRIAACTNADVRVFDFLRAKLAGETVNYASGIRCFSGMQLFALLREWFIVSDSLPSNLRHLRGEVLPWVMDNPFGVLDLALRAGAAKLLVESAAQIVMVARSLQLDEPMRSTLAHVLGRLYLIRTGEVGLGGADVDLFGHNLHLSREDGAHFSEIVPIRGCAGIRNRS